jgi:hypothetical protein
MPQSDNNAAQSLQITLNSGFFQIFSSALRTLPWLPLGRQYAPQADKL